MILRTPSGSSYAGAAIIGLVLASAAGAAPADTPALKPSTAIPHVADEPAGQYYIQLLKWSRDAKLGPVTARVTYLDPPLYLAWLRQSAPDVDQVTFEKGLSGFPGTLRVRVGFQAAERTDIHAKNWKVSLVGSDGKAVPASDSKRIAPVDLKSGPSGEFWEDDWDYVFPVGPDFLATTDKGFGVALSGPSGEGKVSWSFGAAQSATSSADGYVVYLGAILTALCGVLLAALYLTRPPRPSIA